MKIYSTHVLLLLAQCFTVGYSAFLLKSTLCPLLVRDLMETVVFLDDEPLQCSCKAFMKSTLKMGVKATCTRETCRDGLCNQFEISTEASRSGAVTSECAREKIQDSGSVSFYSCLTYEFERTGFFRYDDAVGCSLKTGSEDSGCLCEISGNGTFPWPDGYSLACAGRGNKPFWSGFY